MAKVEVYYPGNDTAVVLEEQRVSNIGTISWTWTVPEDTPTGEAEVVVTTAYYNVILGDKKTFLVESNTSTP